MHIRVLKRGASKLVLLNYKKKRGFNFEIVSLYRHMNDA